MSEIYDRYIGENSPHFSSSTAFFTNLNLDPLPIREIISPMLDIICSKMESTYKTPAKISFGAGGFLQNKLQQFMQFDDICLKFFDVASGNEICVIMATSLARTFLIRLLATTLIDDSHGMLFSSTEKGIFSFIVARTLFDLRKILREKMPDLKLIGIYHRQDETINESNICGFGVVNLSLDFAADNYQVSILMPHEIWKTIKKTTFKKNLLLARSGHLIRPCIFNVKQMNVDVKLLRNLQFGDLIVFDTSSLCFEKGNLHGSFQGIWSEMAISGKLQVANGSYQFFSDVLPINNKEDLPMEEIETADFLDDQVSASAKATSKLEYLAKNIRVSLSVELSRLPMTLRELCDIKGGEIIDLHRKIEDPLEMVVEGKVIGHCQPVQIDGRLGIRVLSIEGEKNEKDI